MVISHLHGNPPAISVETGRKMVPNELMPSFAGMEAAIEAVQS